MLKVQKLSLTWPFLFLIQCSNHNMEWHGYLLHIALGRSNYQIKHPITSLNPHLLKSDSIVHPHEHPSQERIRCPSTGNTPQTCSPWAWESQLKMYWVSISDDSNLLCHLGDTEEFGIFYKEGNQVWLRKVVSFTLTIVTELDLFSWCLLAINRLM